MKNLMFICCIVFFSSCEKDSFEKSRSNIIGEWDVEHRTEEIRMDTVFNLSTLTFEIVFNADGSGRREFFSSEQEFNWYYQPNPENFILVGIPKPPIINNSQAYNVLENTSSKQIWTFEYRNSSLESDYLRNTWIMTKK